MHRKGGDMGATNWQPKEAIRVHYYAQERWGHGGYKLAAQRGNKSQRNVRVPLSPCYSNFVYVLGIRKMGHLVCLIDSYL
jgi:hypothetical protein